MIVTVTGLPGNGKTLYTLVYVKAWAEREKRAVWYHGIKDLKLPWHRVPVKLEKINGEDKEVPQWWEVPTGSIVVIDEAQNAGFGVRGRGQVPVWAQKLETHRHLGIDLVFITQDPSLLDSHDRRLSERHFHLVRMFGAAASTIHEFKTGVQDNVSKAAGRKASIKHKWKFPKSAYAFYTSAEQHTHKMHLPMRVWVFIFLGLALPVFVWYLVHRLDPRNKAATLDPSSASAGSPGFGRPPMFSGKLTRDEYLQTFAPRVTGLAYTAPVYDEVTKPVVAPYPAACVASATRCQCYSQQGTRLETPAYLCKSISEGGFFIAWQQPEAKRQESGQRGYPADPAPIGGAVVFPHTPTPGMPATPGPEATVVPTYQAGTNARGASLPKPS